MNCEKILIHHCNDKYKYKFAKEAKEYLLSKNVTTQVVPIDKGTNQFVL